MAKQKRDYYEVLGVEKSVDDVALKKAYRTLAKKYHPDMNPGDVEAEKKFKEASEAYAVLSDPEKKQKYDQFGHSAVDGSGGGYGGGGGGFDFNGADFGDIFGDLFGDIFGGGRRSSQNPNGPKKGASLRAAVKITFLEAVFGCERELEISLKDTCGTCKGTGAKQGTKPETCAKCGGKGQVVFTQQSFFGTVRNVQACPDCGGSGTIIREKCENCHGTGYVANKKRIKIQVPAGIDEGQIQLLTGYGEPGKNGGPRGDLQVEVIIGRHPIFQRNNMDIYSSVPISYAIAALGGEIVIETVDGKVVYEVKPGTQTDTRVRLKGKGVPNYRRPDTRGDHFVTLVINTPDKLSPEAKELLKQFDAASGDSLNFAKKVTDGIKNKDDSNKKGFWK